MRWYVSEMSTAGASRGEEVRRGFLEEARFELSLVPLLFQGQLLAGLLSGSASPDLQYLISDTRGKTSGFAGSSRAAQAAPLSPPPSLTAAGGGADERLSALSPLPRQRLGSVTAV